MRFFTSISIAALCFVAIIQAAPAPQLPQLPGTGQLTGAVGQVAGELPPPANKLGETLGGAPKANTAQANGVQRTTQGESVNHRFLSLHKNIMRFFTSISITALYFVASIQAAPAPQAGLGLPGADQVTGAVGQVTQKLPPPANKVGDALGGGTPNPNAAKADGAQGASQPKSGGLRSSL
ncbi:hypothetical protein K492DRAFT_199970 [Lichtheimia hyalospora FSU 10163]|nr:hypothetical protein K492DRAFT_199970 [Lichtheimia hyalospora FSU 10163]